MICLECHRDVDIYSCDTCIDLKERAGMILSDIMKGDKATSKEIIRADDMALDLHTKYGKGQKELPI